MNKSTQWKVAAGQGDRGTYGCVAHEWKRNNAHVAGDLIGCWGALVKRTWWRDDSNWFECVAHGISGQVARGYE